MAGRGGKSSEPKPASARVEDGELFPFKTDALSGPIAPLKITKPRKKKKKKEEEEPEKVGVATSTSSDAPTASKPAEPSEGSGSGGDAAESSAAE